MDQILSRISERDFAARLANEHAADLVVICSLKNEDRGSSKGLAQSQAVLRLSAINPNSAQEFIGDESELTGAGDTAAEAARAAARRVATETADYAINQLILWWIRQTEAGSGREFIVELQNPGDVLRTGRAFRQQIEKVQGVRQVETDSQSAELVRLRVLFEGGNKNLLIDGIADKCAEVPSLAGLDLALDRGTQLVFRLGPQVGGKTSGQLTVAVFPFANKSQWPNLDTTADACAMSAENALVGGRNLRLVDRSRLDEVLQESDLKAVGLIDGPGASRLGKLLPAEAILLGELTGVKTEIMLNARLVRTDTGEVLASVSVSAHVDQRQTLPELLAAKLKESVVGDAVKNYCAKLGLPSP